jgi:hypothetical protein
MGSNPRPLSFNKVALIWSADRSSQVVDHHQ